MSTAAITPTPPPIAPPLRRGYPLLAWLVIFAIVGFILWRQAHKPAPKDDAAGIVPLQMQGRYLVGVNSLKFPGAKGDALYDGPLLDALPGADLVAYERTMRRLRALPVEVVHGGHDESFGRARLVALVDAWLDAR